MRDFSRLNGSVLDRRAATELVDGLDLEAVPYCAACLFELGWALHQGRRLHPSTVGRVADWTWPEMADGLRAAVVDARMREVPRAEDGLRDLEERGFRGMLARVVVERLAERMAEELERR